jgi:tetratricopeptide (TPR) repeat protein
MSEEHIRLLRNAERDISQGRLDLAAERYEKILYSDHNQVDALVGMSRIALATDAYPEARKFAEKALAVDADRADAKVFAALALEGQGERTQAAQEISAALAEHPHDFLVLFHAGRLSAMYGNYNEALEFLNRAAEIKVNDYDIHNLRGNIYMELRALGEAIDMFTDATLIEPQRLEAYFGLADALTLAGDIEMAIKVLDQVRPHFGNDPLFHQKRAGLSLFQGDIDGALAHTKRICERMPHSGRAWLNLGLLSLWKQDAQAAEEAFVRAREAEPGLWETHFQLALLYDAAALEDQAILGYRKAAELAPNQWEPLNNLGLLLLGGDDSRLYDEAEQLFRRAVSVSGGEVFAPYFNLALCLTKQNKTAEAIELCTQLKHQDLDPEQTKELDRLIEELTS